MKSKKEAQGSPYREQGGPGGLAAEHAGQARGIVSTLTGVADEKQLLFPQRGRGSLPWGRWGLGPYGAEATRRAFLGLRRWGLAGLRVSGLRCSERQAPHLWAIPTTGNKVGGWVCRRPSSRWQGVHVCETRSVNPRPSPVPHSIPYPLCSRQGPELLAPRGFLRTS